MWLSPGGWVFPLLLAGVGFHVLDLSRRRMGQAEVEGVSWAGTINGRCCCVFPIVIPANNSVSRTPPPPGGGATVRSRSFPLLRHPMPLRYATLRRDQTESQPSLYTKSHAAAQERPLIRNAEPANHGMMMQVFPTKQYPTGNDETLQFFPLPSSTSLSCLEYMRYSSDVLKSSLPCSTCFLVADSIGCGRPMDSRNPTAKSPY